MNEIATFAVIGLACYTVGFVNCMAVWFAFEVVLWG